MASLEELDWHPYLWLAQEGIMLLVYTNLLSPLHHLFCYFPPFPSVSLSLISSSFSEQQSAFFADRDVTKLVMWKSRGMGGMIRNMSEFLFCIRIGSNVNSLISSLQTAGERAISKLCHSQPISKPLPETIDTPVLVNVCYWHPSRINSQFRVENATAIFPKMYKMGIKIQIFADL